MPNCPAPAARTRSPSQETAAQARADAHRAPRTLSPIHAQQDAHPPGMGVPTAAAVAFAHTRARPASSSHRDVLAEAYRNSSGSSARRARVSDLFSGTCRPGASDRPRHARPPARLHGRGASPQPGSAPAWPSGWTRTAPRCHLPASSAPRPPPRPAPPRPPGARRPPGSRPGGQPTMTAGPPAPAPCSPPAVAPWPGTSPGGRHAPARHGSPHHDPRPGPGPPSGPCGAIDRRQASQRPGVAAGLPICGSDPGPAGVLRVQQR